MSGHPDAARAGALRWDDLVTAALLGVARRPVDPATLPGEVGRLAAGLPEGDASGRLLDAAALLTVARRAGRVPVVAGEAPSTAPPESAEPASAAAGARLAELLARTDAVAGPLREEWLGLATARGLRVPPALLPRLLDWAGARGERGEVSRDRAERLAPVLGERGRWLARRRPDWSAVVAGDAPATADAWTHGTPAERRTWLRELRHRDAAAARSLLLGTDPGAWRGDERAELYGVLADHLSPEDEAVLERALDDSRQDVRTGAAAMLRRLPGSAFAARAAARVVPLVRVERRRLRRVLVVGLPDLDEHHRDDRALPAPPAGTGERAWLLRHLVLATPLTAWQEALGLSPDELVGLPVADDLAATVRAGWLGAARAQGDPTWARALMRDADGGERVALLPVLEPQERARYVAAALDALAPGTAGAAGTSRGALTHVDALLSTCPRPWPPDLTDAVVRWLGRERSTDAWHADWTLRTVATRLPTGPRTEQAVRDAGLARTPDDPWRARVLTVADTLQYRRHLDEELR